MVVLKRLARSVGCYLMFTTLVGALMGAPLGSAPAVGVLAVGATAVTLASGCGKLPAGECECCPPGVGSPGAGGCWAEESQKDCTDAGGTTTTPNCPATTPQE